MTDSGVVLMAFEDLTDQALAMVMAYLPKLILAIIVLIVGWKVSKWIVRIIEKKLAKQVEPTLKHFLGSVVGVFLKVIVIIMVASMVGIQTTSLIAVLGAAGLAVGLALQGSLSNFAGGVLIAIFKPFEVGDLIDAQGSLGTVEKIEIFNTVLKTPDNKVVVIPNGNLSNDKIINVTKEKTRRVDMVFGIGYGDDIDKAVRILKQLVETNKKVLKKPEAQVRVKELADSSVNFVVRPWCKTEDYWDVYFGVTEEVKKSFDKEGVSIPFPQKDVHLFRESE